MIGSVESSLQPFTVSIPVFSGPLDLLLGLIERAELDITTIALAQVTAPFLAYIRRPDNFKPEELSGFLLIAARLMVIKSEALLPRPPVREAGEEDPGDELIRQLILYKKYKEISEILRDREFGGLRTFLRLAPPLKIEGKLELSGLTFQDLVNAYESITLESTTLGLAISRISTPVVTIRQRISDITDALRKSGRSTFGRLVENQHDRTTVVVTFLALLELVKQYVVYAHQETPFAEIDITPTGDLNADIDLEFAD